MQGASKKSPIRIPPRLQTTIGLARRHRPCVDARSVCRQGRDCAARRTADAGRYRLRQHHPSRHRNLRCHHWQGASLLNHRDDHAEPDVRREQPIRRPVHQQ